MPIGHKAFAPILGLWGALLGGLSVLVMPAALLAKATRDLPIGQWDKLVQPVLAMAAALVLGTVLFSVASALSSRSRQQFSPHSADDADDRPTHLIDPLRDLGTHSLDDPIETMPFESPAWRDADLDVREPEFVPLFDQEFEPAGHVDPAPRELDLGEFAAMPGRNAVWVEDPPVPAPVPAVEPVQAPAPASAVRRAAPPARPAPGTAALTRLRAVPPTELSTVEMVERFAGALHEHRATPPARALGGAELAAREAALAEALKSLANLSGDKPAGHPGADRDTPLQAALSQLHVRRGAA
ncbi:MAG: hypothetical protein EAY70_03150 [Sphingomonadales bacterium]|nr:MAG: hypothetical protein EAY70_03150 [Sphingomonadales bacterium]